MQLSSYSAQHFLWSVDGGVGRVVLNRPERKNPLTFESYAELRDLFRNLAADRSIRTIVVSGAGENFCSGGDVHEIIGPLTKMDMTGLLGFTRMTGDRVKAMRVVRRPSSLQSTVFAPAPARSSRWSATCASARPARASLFSSIASASQAATWVRAQFCRVSSGRGAQRSCCISGGA